MPRKVYFYEVNAGRGSDGEYRPFDPTPALETIDALPYKLEDGRYLEADKGSFYCARIESAKPPQKVVYFLSRRADLPEVEKDGDFTALAIPPNAGIGEKIHIIFFGRYVAADFNFYGPRATTFPAYLSLRAKAAVPAMGLSFSQLLHGEAAEKLKKLEGLTMARMKLSKSALTIAREADESVHAMLTATFDSTNADELELILRTGRPKKHQSRRFLDTGLFSWITRLSTEQATYEQFDKLEARGINRITKETDRIIDVLQDEMISTVSMVRANERSRAIDSEDAFRKIATAFQQMKPHLFNSFKVD